jgi:hypothetical protein
MQAAPDQPAAALDSSSMQAGAAGAANGSSSAGGGPAYSSDFEIVVNDPVKQGEGVSAYVSYKVRWLGPKLHPCTYSVSLACFCCCCW